MLTLEQTKDIIKNNEKVVVKLWRDNCPFCIEYAPIFTAAAEKHKDHTFASLKTTPEILKEFDIKSVPATLVYHNGELKHKYQGRLFPDQLSTFITSGEVPAAMSVETWVIQASLEQLDKALAQHKADYEKVNHALGVIEAEAKRRKEKLDSMVGCKSKTIKEAAKSFFTIEGWKNPCCFCKRVRKVMLVLLIVVGAIWLKMT